MSVATQDTLRKEGNELLKCNDIRGAVSKYSEAIQVAGEDHLLFSNRSAALLLLREFNQALKDADRCIELAPSWGKSYLRKFNVLIAMGQFLQAHHLCESALLRVGQEDSELVRSMLGQCQVELVHQSLRGIWKGRVSEAMGGYTQTMTFGEGNSVRIDVFGRHQNCKYSLDLSKGPSALTIMFGAEAGNTTVPYIFELKDSGESLAMCCPFLVPELPVAFDGPGYVLMRKGDRVDEVDTTVSEKRARLAGLKHPELKMMFYLEEFAKVVSEGALNISQPESSDVPGDDETEANKKIIQVMAMHVKMTELEQVFGAELAKSAFGVISRGDDYFKSSPETKVAADRLRDLLISSGFLSSESLEQARLQYTKTVPNGETNSSSRTRLQKKLMQKNSERKVSGHDEVLASISDPSPNDFPNGQRSADVPRKDSPIHECRSQMQWPMICGVALAAVSIGILVRKFFWRS